MLCLLQPSADIPQALGAGECVPFPDGNAGAFWPGLELSVPACNYKKFSTLAVVEHHCTAQSSYKSLHASAEKI